MRSLLRCVPICCLLAVASLVAVGCSQRYRPEPAPLNPETAAAASSVLASASDRVSLVEGGLLLPRAYHWEEQRSVEPRTEWDPAAGRYEMVWREEVRRVLAGPESVYLAYADVRAVSMRTWALWAGVEFELVEPQGGAADPAQTPTRHNPLLVELEDEASARALVEALDLLVRSVRRQWQADGQEDDPDAERAPPPAAGPE